ncbi:transcriptional regulator GcvA [Aggregicoccus sp. 17bor-14]|uniref:transcriptional regulator GcvA n=1 Tax=Myxococcaceae TaxID=31 RepID=UPI00129CA4EA|nr:MULTISPECIES: transcriptional regulator GcvA [Myxococcaceae]MBF5043425.1 transcriptional regulator GcvA [Simulacricoccus sp. 17bor-14]MRI89183.1 transcriptional regulator GcvA [Aggregicoccus sp. 17bor-14]
MFDRLPPLQTLRAFEATGRLLSMTRAAKELHVTHGAVSRHIKTLEEDLGVALFRRLTRQLVLTEAGAELLVAVTRVLGELTREAERLRTQDRVSRLTISTSISFASKWLAPRLHRLQARHPELDIHLDVTDAEVDLNDGQVDAAIRYGNGPYRRALSERILQETVTPVCSPAYLAQHGALPSPASLVRCTLLHEDRMLANWEQWLALAGVDRARHGRGPAYSHGSMAIDAAIRGEGVALGRSALVADDIAAGRLVAPFPQLRLTAERGYDLVYRTGNRSHPKVCALRDWLEEELRPFRTE